MKWIESYALLGDVLGGNHHWLGLSLRDQLEVIVLLEDFCLHRRVAPVTGRLGLCGDFERWGWPATHIRTTISLSRSFDCRLLLNACLLVKSEVLQRVIGGDTCLGKHRLRSLHFNLKIRSDGAFFTSKVARRNIGYFVVDFTKIRYVQSLQEGWHVVINFNIRLWRFARKFLVLAFRSIRATCSWLGVCLQSGLESAHLFDIVLLLAKRNLKYVSVFSFQTQLFFFSSERLFQLFYLKSKLVCFVRL